MPGEGCLSLSDSGPDPTWHPKDGALVGMGHIPVSLGFLETEPCECWFCLLVTCVLKRPRASAHIIIGNITQSAGQVGDFSEPWIILCSWVPGFGSKALGMR